MSISNEFQVANLYEREEKDFKGYRLTLLLGEPLGGQGSAFVVTLDPYHVEEEHSHGFAQFYFVLEGSADLMNEKARLKEGTAMIVPPDYVYGFKVGKQGIKLLVVQISEIDPAKGWKRV